MPKTSAKSKKAAPAASQTHSYQKVIVRPGSYKVPAKRTTPGAFQDDSGRWWIETTFSNERLQRIADNARTMGKAGLKIPAPFAHRDSKKVRVGPVKIGSDGATLLDIHDKPLGWDASLNGGFWNPETIQLVDDVSKINPEFAAGPGLVGTVDTFGDPNDLNTPAGKVSRTVQETSICVLPKYQPPGFEKPIEDFIAHIAMPVHAVEAGQDNFAEAVAMSEESDDDLFVVSMSALMESNPTGETAENDDPQMIEVLGLLQQLKIDLPPDTNRDSLVERLNLVLRQKLADQKEMNPANPLTQAPTGSQSKPAPVAMSQDSSDSAVVKALISRETKAKKQELKKRLKKLVDTGSHEMSQAVVDELTTEIDAISMSAEDLTDEGDFPVPLAESKIALLERTARPLTGSLIDDLDGIQMSAPDGSRLEEKPAYGEEEDLPADYIESMVNRALPISA